MTDPTPATGPTPGTGPTPASALEARLVDLGRRVDLPGTLASAPAGTPAGTAASTSDLEAVVLAAVLARLDEPAASPFGRRRTRLRRTSGARRTLVRATAAAVAALVLVLAATPVGQAAVARVVHAFGVVLRLGSPEAPRRPERLPQQSVTALDRARSQVRYPVIVPPSLGAPDEVLVSDGGRVLSLVYRAGPGRPAPGPGGVSARLDEFDGALNPGFLKELSADAQFLELPGDQSAVWIAGPHTVEYVDQSGTVHPESAHLAGHTMLWSVGAVTLRLEGDFTLEQARAIVTATLPR